MVMQARAQATRAAIIQAALDLFEDSGYGSTGLTDIINKAAVTKGAFYYHFHTKESVAAAVVEGSYEEIHRMLVTTIEAPSGPALENLIRATFAVAEAMRRNQLVRVGHQLRLLVPAVRAVGKSSFTERRQIFISAIESAVAAGDVLADVDPAEAADSIRSAMVGAQIVFDAGAGDIYTGLRSSWRIILRGIASESSLAYFEEFVTRVAARYQSGADQAR